MSRADYDDDCSGCDLIRWRGQVAAAIKGKRGQQFLRKLAETLDTMPEKRLTGGALETGSGCCTLGAEFRARAIDTDAVDDEDYDLITELLNIAEPLAREIMHLNDEGGGWQETPEKRWQRMRQWVQSQIKTTPETAPCA